MTGVQLPLVPAAPAVLPLDPRQVAELPAPDQGRLYAELGLDPMQRVCIEEAVALVVAGRYGEWS